MSILIKEVKSKRDIKRFMEFGNKLYKDCHNYIPPMFSDEVKSASKKHNLSLEFCDTVLFLAYKDGEIVGRIRGLVNTKYNKKIDVLHARFNHFDFIDDYEVSKALFDAFSKWGKEKGMVDANGPIGYNDLDKQGLLIDGFEQEGMFITYYNYPYYMDHFEKLGLVKDCDWVEYKVMIPKEMNPRVMKISKRLLTKHEYEIKEFKNKKELVPYLYKIFHTYNEAFAPLHGVIRLTEPQIDQYVKQYLPVMNLDYISVVVDKEDEVVAFGILGPNLNEPMRKCKGRLFPFGVFPLLKALKNPTVLDMYLVAVRPDKQGLGLNSILMTDITNNAIKNKISYAETGPELEDNLKVQSQWKNYDAEIIRRRRCYIKKL